MKKKMKTMISLLSIFLIVSCGGSDSGCFVKGTQIKTADGEVAIENLKRGDQVTSYDVETGEVVTGVIDKVTTRTVDTIGELELSNGVKVGVTGDHPIYSIKDSKFVRVDSLNRGDEVGFYEGGNQIASVVIKSVSFKQETTKVYNIKVKNYNTSFAEGILAEFYE